MKKANILLSLLFLLCVSCNEAVVTNEIDFREITLVCQHNLSEESLVVNITKYDYNRILVRYKYTPLISNDSIVNEFTTYNISNLKFDSLVKIISKIDRENIEFQSQIKTFDGISTDISFYYENEFTRLNIYHIASPHDNTIERKIEDYLIAYNELVKLAKLETENTFN